MQDFFNTPFVLLIGLLAVYFAVLAIRGKGKPYELERIRVEVREEYTKKARVYFGISAVLGAAMMYFSMNNMMYPLIGVFVTLIVLIVVMTKTTKKYYKR